MPSESAAVPPANGIHCFDCDGFANYYEGEIECPYDLDHATEPVYITTTPLGLPDDDDYRLGRQDKWVYEAEEDR